MSSNTMDKAGQSEARFITKAFEKGWEITKPFHHAQSYDFVIRKNGKWQTVQVKSAYEGKDRYGRYHKVVNIRRSNEKGSRPYKVGDFDLLAVIYQERIWLIGWKEIRKIRSNIRIEQNKYDKFLI